MDTFKMASTGTFLVLGNFLALYFTSGHAINTEDRLREMSEVLAKVHLKNAEMRETIQAFDNRINYGKTRIQEIRNKITQLDDTKLNLKKRMDALNDKLNSGGSNGKQRTSLKKIRQLHSATVGFSAVISKADLTNLNSGQPLVFDHVITNVGDAYNSTTGEFTAPISGLYVFNMDILVEAGENEYLQFVKDGSHVMYNFAHASGALHDESSSRLVVIELKTGNRLWVRTAPNAHHGSGNLHGNGFSTFSGSLLAVTE